ncbi:sporulation protein [Clostridium sp. P21]|uniref:Sporulation protein n=1 Tax=Clostridium muellerianum TaxID=2716538 RepID=A0A7Y0EHT1_9CLOT|nr:spore germination protein GerW family protein [Clostridium muellerianum]NMM63357.1 sporulation protein [Clostridium muellerianum]
MSNGSSIPENLEVLFNKLQNFLKTETVVGEPIVVGETTLVPIISVSFGCGTGSGGGTDDKGANGSGGGLGFGAKVTPNAMLVIKNDSVTMLPVNNKSNVENLLQMVPGIMSKFKKDKKNNDKEEKTTEEA